MKKGQKGNRNFPHVKGLLTKRTKNGQRYVLTETDENGKTHSITVKILETDTKKEFLEKIEEAREELHSRDQKKSFDGYIKDYLKFKMLSKSTASAYTRILKDFSFDGKTNKKAINSILTSGNSPETISLYVRFIKAFFSWIIQNGVSIENPTKGISIKRNMKSRSRILTDTEIEKVIKYANTKEPLYRLFILLLLHTGARVSSVIAMRKSDLTKKGLIIYNVKCKKYYDYTIPVKCKQIISLWNKCIEVGSIFGEKGETYHRRLNKWLLKNLGLDAKGESISAHSFRHTFASRAAMNGIPMEVISKLLDHQSVATTAKFYARFSQKQIDDAVKKTIKDYQM